MAAWLPRTRRRPAGPRHSHSGKSDAGGAARLPASADSEFAGELVARGRDSRPDSVTPTPGRTESGLRVRPQAAGPARVSGAGPGSLAEPVPAGGHSIPESLAARAPPWQ